MNTPPKPGAIHLHIDKLVLSGFSHINEAALTAALHETLVRELLSAQSLYDTNLSNIRTNVSLPAHYSASTLGSTLARSLADIACSDSAQIKAPHHG